MRDSGARGEGPMGLTRAAERAALSKLVDYLNENPAENIDKIMVS